MRRALSLASLGLRKTSPNPLVGCVIVKDGRIIGSGWHKNYGGPHAEINALNDAMARGESVRGSTVYVTLEPCSHWGKTPPCADRLVREGVSEVVIAMRDPNPKVNGRGIEILRDAGIRVSFSCHELEREAMFLNRGFVFVQKYHRPFITLKAAMSLDGRLCLPNGSSKWLTGILARTEAHRMRAENDAVLVGVNTVLTDDPELTVRNVVGLDPIRVVLDHHGRTPSNAKVRECMILNHESLHESMHSLADSGVLTLMVEGGAEVLASFLREGLADYVKLFYSPRILGDGKSINFNAGFETVRDSLRLTGIKTKRLGDDFMIEGFIQKGEGDCVLWDR